MVIEENKRQRRDCCEQPLKNVGQKKGDNFIFDKNRKRKPQAKVECPEGK